jgi:PAS domain S-box-containing protein
MHVTMQNNHCVQYGGRGPSKDRLYEAVVQSVSDAIITKTLDGRITGWNRAAERLFGFSADEAIGQPIGIIVPPEAGDEIDRLLERSAEGEFIEHFVTVRRTKDGESIGAAKIIRDITEQKFIERKFELAVEACPSGILMIDASRTILLVNAERECPIRLRQVRTDRKERRHAPAEAAPSGSRAALRGDAHQRYRHGNRAGAPQ